MGKINYTGLEVAVIGMSGRFPGASTISEFWQNIRDGKESVTFFSDSELLEMGVKPELFNNPEYVRSGGTIKDKEYFDAAFFSYPSHEAAIMEPQIRVFHECVWEALEDSGNIKKLNDFSVGIFAGAQDNPYWRAYAMIQESRLTIDSFSASQLNNREFISSLIAYKLNLRGPAVYVNTACSTSLVAIHMACRSLLTGEAYMTIAGGIAFQSRRQVGYMYQEGTIFSKDGHCRTFDATASGTIGGEGAGVVILKKLQDAIKDGDRIYAVVKGSSINNDGNRKVGYTAPSVEGQSECIRIAHKMARVTSPSIGYVEAHGTATALGDPIEVAALKMAFAPADKAYCALGAVKANIGHLDAAAGVAGFIKTVLAVKNQELPPHINFSEPISELKDKNNPFYINTSWKKWKNENETPRRAGVSSFGIGGTNVHFVIEEMPESVHPPQNSIPALITLSAKTSTALNNNLIRLRNFIQNHPDLSLQDIAGTLLFGRQEFNHRKTFVADSAMELIDQLTQACEEKGTTPVVKAHPKIIFMFSGQGAQYLNMSKDLYNQLPVFKKFMDIGFSILKQYSGKDFEQILFGDDATSIHNTENTQPLLFIVEYALTQMLFEYGIQPSAMIGHSIGEYTAACVAGVFSFEQALELVFKRAKLMSRIQGSMLSISKPVNELTDFIKDGVSIAAINSPASCVLSGADKDIQQLENLLNAKGIEYKKLKTSGAFHSSQVDSILPEFKKVLDTIKMDTPTIPFFSNYTGKIIEANEATSAEYWISQLRNTVKFSDSIETLIKNEETVFVEIGPGMGLCTLVNQHRANQRKEKTINILRHPQEEENDLQYFINKLGQLWTYGATLNWEKILKPGSFNFISLPGYAFDKVKYKYLVEISNLAFAAEVGNQQVEEAHETVEISRESKSLASEYALPVTTMEKMLTQIWLKVFGIDKIGIHDDFFEIGGNSLLVVRIITAIKKRIKTNVKTAHIFKGRTISRIAKLIEEIGETDILIELSPIDTDKPNIFMVHAMNSGSEVYHSFAKRMSSYLNCYGIDNYNFTGKEFISSLTELAKVYVKRIKEIQPQGPYILLGYSLGGQIVLEMAAALEEQGETEITLFLMDALVPDDKIKTLLSKVDFKIIQKQLQTVKIKEGYDPEYIDMMYAAFFAELELYASGISRRLIHSRALLFKAGELDMPDLGNEKNLNAIREYRIGLECNNVDTVCDHLSTIVLKIRHDTMFQMEEVIVASIKQGIMAIK